MGTLTVDGYRIESLTMQTWDAFADLAERHNGVWGGCWCTYFHLHPDPKEERRALGHREFKRLLVEAGRAHAALVFDGDVAVDFVGRYESMADDLKLALGHVGLSLEAELPRAKTTFRRNTLPYRDYYDDETRGIVARWYAREIELLDYEF